MDRLIEQGPGRKCLRRRELAGRMIAGSWHAASKVWVDHVVVEGSAELSRSLAAAWLSSGRSIVHALGVPVLRPRRWHLSSARDCLVRGRPRRLAPACGVRELAIKVESAVAFSRAHDLGLEISWAIRWGLTGAASIPGKRTTARGLERRAYLGFEPFPGETGPRGRMAPQAVRDALDGARPMGCAAAAVR